MQAELKGLLKASKYSAIPNKLGFCGPPNSFQKLEEFIADPTKEKAVEAERILQKFNALFPYLELIASSNSLQPFDEQVVEAYWVGNSLLEKVSSHDLKKTVLSLQRFGMSESIAEKKAAGIVEGMLPHHSFHVLYINFINPKVKPIIENLSNCLVQWGKVKEGQEQHLIVKAEQLLFESNQLKLREKIKKVEKGFVQEAKKNDFVSVHWNKAVELIDKDQLEQLKRYTLQNLNHHALLH